MKPSALLAMLPFKVGNRLRRRRPRPVPGIDPRAWLATFALLDEPALYGLGMFDTGVTVLRQQIRALNLAWALVESGTLPEKGAEPMRVAVVGAGFAGLTFAAALLQKEANCKITVLEEHDALLPLQQGSDTRWLHPHIYDWPDESSEADVAMLPLLNWTAARASDVVFQVLQDWKRAVGAGRNISVYCNTRHLQIAACDTERRRTRIEWVGEPRDPADGMSRSNLEAAQGVSGSFDLVVVAVGFGIEAGKPSYWRNETLGQPNLHQRRRTHLVSGQGDGAMIDLLRVRIGQYRQDRIIEEMFADKPGLLGALRRVKDQHDRARSGPGLFASFDAIFDDAAPDSPEWRVLDRLSRRLRRDTDAVLHIKVRELAQLLDPGTSRISFQNALLVYLLYRVGGFSPSFEDEQVLRDRYSIAEEHVVRRHGTKRNAQLERMLAKPLHAAIEKRRKRYPDHCRQEPEISWPGGYFGFPGRTADVVLLTDNELRSRWRKEYLPGPTALAAAAICGAVTGVLHRLRPGASHFRVTLHRVLALHREELLQQACDYVGKGFDQPSSTAGRTFPAGNATIGLAYSCRSPVRTRHGVSREAIRQAMDRLSLHDAARSMLPEISYVLAMPVLQPDEAYLPPSTVAAVLYIDSKDQDFALSDDELVLVGNVLESAFRGIVEQDARPFLGIRNIPFGAARAESPTPLPLPESVVGTVELLDPRWAPTIRRPFVLNFDYADPASPEAVR